MRRLAHGLAALYPRQWRLRYGREFDALLDDASLTWVDMMDLLAGALKARINTWNTGPTPEGENDAMDQQANWPRIIELRDYDVTHGYELETVMERTRADGKKELVRQFFREVDLGNCYVTVSHRSWDTLVTETFIVLGTKGEVTGDFRTDRTETLILHADGTVRRSEQTVKTWLKYEPVRERLRESYRNGMKEGLSAEDVYRTIRSRGEAEPAR